MKLLFDENIELSIVKYFRSQGLDIRYIAEDFPSISDVEVIKIAFREKRLIITKDLDFGYLIYKSNKDHFGIILIRLRGKSIDQKITILEFLLKKYFSQLNRIFAVIDNQGIRVRIF